MNSATKFVGMLLILGLGVIGILSMTTALWDVAVIVSTAVVAHFFWRWAS